MSAEASISLTKSDRDALVKHLGVGKDGTLSTQDIQQLIDTVNNGKLEALHSEVQQVIHKFRGEDGKLDTHGLHKLQHQVTLSESQLRYAGYSAAFARAFRYLAFTSDFGEALRPVVARRVVNATYAVSFGYCGADIAWEAYKLHKRDYRTEAGQPMSMAQLLVERSAFQGIASIAVPALIIHTTVDVSKHMFKRIGRFTRWGPSALGLAVIPFLPLYLDAPVEHGVEWFLHKYGPWASDSGHDKAE